MASTLYGTIIHKGFYDLLAYTSSFIAGPRYESIPPSSPPVVVESSAAAKALALDKGNYASPNPGPKPGARITKDMISHPREFKHLVHASDADQAELLLRRWGPDQIGKLGDPRWAEPIKRVIRQQKAVAEVVSAYPHQGYTEGLGARGDDGHKYDDGGKLNVKVQTKGEIEANIRAPLLQAQTARTNIDQMQSPGQGQFQSQSQQPPRQQPLGPLRVINQVTEPTLSTVTVSSTGATLHHADIVGFGFEGDLAEGLSSHIHGLPPQSGFISPFSASGGGGGFGPIGSAALPGQGGPGPRPSTLRKGGLETHFEVSQPTNRGRQQEQKQLPLPFPTLMTNPDTSQLDIQSQIEESLSSSIHEGRRSSSGFEIRELSPTPATKPQPQPQPQPQPLRQRTITPSLPTLEKAISCRIYFENLYFPLLRHPPSREQRRLAMEQDMDILGINEQLKETVRDMWKRNETEYLREQRRKVDVNCFERIRIIGHGAFGVVSLVREKQTGQLLAMKQLRKTDMLRKGQEGHVRAERDVLKSAALVGGSVSEWIVKLFYSFQDSDHLYLILEYMGGGDLLNLLIAKDIFEENFARFYVAEMILAIEQCHKHGFIHRDIKPDNFLFDPDGHLKLSDFGLATDLHWAHDTTYYDQQRKSLLHKYGVDIGDNDGAHSKTTRKLDKKEIEEIMGKGKGSEGLFTWREKNRKRLAYSVCGTNSYMSPEVIRGNGYTFSCDWWSLGVIMYECLYGYPPFVSNSRHVTRQRILNWKQSLKFPSHPLVSPAGIDLMKQLLCEPEDRLGSRPYESRPSSLIAQNRRSGFYNLYGGRGSVDGAELIKAHAWFSGIDWVNIRRYPAPFRPELTHPADTRHFDNDIPDEPLAPANGAPANATRDPILRDKVHGPRILEMRKALAFAGFTHKSPRGISYDHVRIQDVYAGDDSKTHHRPGHDTVREINTSDSFRRGRAMSF